MSSSDTRKLHDLCVDLCKLGNISDEELFKQPPPKEDCPICFVRLPSFHNGIYQTCCGKVICSGCFFAPVYDNQGNEVIEKVCPFCRVLRPTSDEEVLKRERKRAEDNNDAIAIYNQGVFYSEGRGGYQQDYDKALELFYLAGKLGYAKAYSSIGSAYDYGRGVEVDEKMAHNYYELGAIGGDVNARYNLGVDEMNAGLEDEERTVGKMGRALKHYKIATKDGDAESLDKIKEMFTHGYATKEDYTKALQSYQTYLGEIKSRQRDEAAAFSEEFRYY